MAIEESLVAAVPSITLDRALPDSIELKRDSKGAYSWTIKLYGESGKQGTMLRRVKALNRAMLRAYAGAEDDPS